MNISRAVFIGISLLIIIRLAFVRDGELVVAGFILTALAGMLVWFSDFLAEYVLGFGFMQFFATDFKHPERSSAAIAFLGWVMLVLFGVLVLFL